MNIPHYSVPADPGSVRASSPTHPLLPWIGMAMPLIVGIVSTAVIVGERVAAGSRVIPTASTPSASAPAAAGGGGGAVLWDEPRVISTPTAEEILELVNVLADRRVKKALEELGEGSCLRKG